MPSRESSSTSSNHSARSNDAGSIATKSSDYANEASQAETVIPASATLTPTHANSALKLQHEASPDLPPIPALDRVSIQSRSSPAPSPTHTTSFHQSQPSIDSLTFVQPSRSSRQGHERYPSQGTLNGSSAAPSSWPQLEDEPEIVPTGFDESVLRALCELDCGVPLLLDRIKQGIVSCREVATFFKKRAALEDGYGRDLQKLARLSGEQYSLSEGKAGSFVSSWHANMRIHETVAENRIKFAMRLNEMSDELLNLAKEVERNRKQSKELGNRYERSLQDAEAGTEKAKTKFDSNAEELERLLVMKEGETMKEAGLTSRTNDKGGQSGKRVLGKAINKGGMLLKGKNPASLIRQEEDVRNRLTTSSDAYRKALLEAQHIRQEYFNFQLPRILRSLKECSDEIDLGTQYHLSRYAHLYESTLLGDGSALAPVPNADSTGIKDIMENIDSRGDFKVYMQNYAIANSAPRGPRREGPPEEQYVRSFLLTPSLLADVCYQLSFQPQHVSRPSNDKIPMSPEKMLLPTFGVDLAEQMARDNVEVPRIMERCVYAIEANGLQSVGLYRLSGMTSRLNRLKAAFDRDVETPLLDEEAATDVNIVSGTLKLWLRELPEPLFTHALYPGFIEAARIENDRLRHIRLHERVNDLPDANYATLKFLMGHLHKVSQHADVNQMRISNLSIVFGPTLLSPPMGGMPGVESGAAFTDNQWQSRAVETILDHYLDIFVEEGEDAQ
ncbi:RhoGAP-domain-containing protein [Calocera viscosa TUFC12733]|uniref:RhoGAP-domain-containing protein n=1 Tax=Calocera viscosa (strain TUFC12733) TaxID=1330018 RepID=A0A167S3J8_CALVF|nr:RhoGAP-domain-containing protein [Calocera viscosa TUFC12733]